VKLVHLVGFIIKKSVTMHGHMNVKRLEFNWNIAEEDEHVLKKKISIIIIIIIIVIIKMVWKKAIAH
jgi:hypothetical protein